MSGGWGWLGGVKKVLNCVPSYYTIWLSFGKGAVKPNTCFCRYLPLGETFDFLRRIARAAPLSVTLEVSILFSVCYSAIQYVKSIGDTYIKGKSFKNEIYLVTIGNKNGKI